MSFRIDYPHSLPIDDARERMRALGDYLSNKHGLSVSWTGENSARISGKYLIVTIDGTVSVEANQVKFDGKDPGMLWRGKAREYLTHKLAQYMDASKSVESLARS